MWNTLVVNCITKSCIWNTCVTWQGIDYKLPEDHMIVSKHVGVWLICEIIVRLLVVVKKNLKLININFPIEIPVSCCSDSV